ncbi:hypothetical protein [Gracilinema caldarium]|uniref:Uncharacterized protein n=1 Tax=Gracilinema caldarium (strain ATCC 51460 / DSM 7334 / H1) TaxID=744872 RepID=F8F2Z4_GRAC1|nr:hypothetical protein [Gracilinema caldarium]AEJ19902.1 hypothetical protein Spica_1760 [Gracilinema caldarium DSM 7334]
MSTIKSPVGIYLNKKDVDAMPAAELKALMQILRLINILRYSLRLNVLIKKDHNKLFDFRNKTEILFYMIASIKEAVKVIYNSIIPIIGEKYISKEIEELYRDNKVRANNWKIDPFYKIVDYIRNNVGFHFSEDIYNGIISEDGVTQNDILIGVAVGETINDFLIIEPYTSIFMKIAEMVPEDIDKLKFHDWLEENTIKETDIICKILEGILRIMIKDKAYKKVLDESIVKD